MGEQSGSESTSEADRLAELRARLAAGDRDAAGPLGELLARLGDLLGALEVWSDAYGERAPGSKRLAELLVREGYPADAVSVWEQADPVWNNPISLYRQQLASYAADVRYEFESDEPEEMSGTWMWVLESLLAQQGEAAVIARIRDWKSNPGGWAATR
ncbi:hypothetical protein KDK95_24495 [Actinospica sp. MGRD01-02]|uniref:Uncharacterized protein n=1 Tax=Actinospica acidithermotolerans TaxID=2828514 RepID=A0A941EFJ9_9ACTN|nr:hypothetical protein [Actinospica acidithermotolerans]MBR7829488.1 hypothetical protein [Actinospica acidithermotolerans]